MARQRLQDWVARSGRRSDEHRDQHRVIWVEELDPDFLGHVTGDVEQRAPSRTQTESDD
jgi:hypothetical protein